MGILKIIKYGGRQIRFGLTHEISITLEVRMYVRLFTDKIKYSTLTCLPFIISTSHQEIMQYQLHYMYLISLSMAPATVSYWDQ